MFLEKNKKMVTRCNEFSQPGTPQKAVGRLRFFSANGGLWVIANHQNHPYPNGTGHTKAFCYWRVGGVSEGGGEEMMMPFKKFYKAFFLQKHVL